MSGRVSRALRERFEARRAILPALVQSVTLDANGRPLGRMSCNIGGNTVQVYTGPNDNYQPGDWVRVEERGGAASASYHAVGFTAGARSDSMLFEIPQQVTIGEATFEQGDLLLGDPLTKHWWYDLSQSAWVMRDVTITHGAIGNLNGLYDYTSALYGSVFGRESSHWLAIDETNGIRMLYGSTLQAQWQGSEVTLGQADQPHLHLAPGTIEFLDAAGAVVSAFDGETQTMFGFNRWGRPLGPALEVGPASGSRYGLWLRGENNVPFVTFLSGSDADPDSVFVRFGEAGATDYLEFTDGGLVISGSVHAAGDDVVIDDDGITLERGDNPTNRIKWTYGGVECGHLGYKYSLGGGFDALAYAVADEYGATYARLLLGAYNIDPLGIESRSSASIALTSETSGSAFAVSKIDITADEVNLPGFNGRGLTVLNAGSDDRDFRVNGQTTAALLAVDASANCVLMGGATNAVKVATDGAMSFEGTAKLAGSNIVWISGAEGVAPNSSLGTTQRLYEAKGSWASAGTAATGAFNFPFPIPYQWFGLSVVVTSITLYYRTVDNAAYITSVYLYASDLDATLTEAIAHTDDLGNGTSGDANHDIVDAAYTMTDFPHFLQINFAGADAAEDVRIYGIKVTWEVV